MRIPVDWLNEYVPNNLSAKELASTLTDVGLEVEDIEDAAGPAVLNITVTPNRGDCLSVLGIARELAMALRTEIKTRQPSLTETGPPASDLATVVLDDPALCPRYSARIVRQVNIAPSPPWAQRRLEQCGLRPINNVVDATNLVMVELGQPLHAFDYRLLRAPAADPRPQIIVRRARQGERLVTIDGEDRSLTSDILLITDPSGPIALAGIMGGTSTEIHAGTTEVLLESAHFDPLTVRRGARALGMVTEASYRFERVVDPGGTIRALDRACELIAEFCDSPQARRSLGEGGVEIAVGTVDAYPNPIAERRIALRPARVNQLLGLQLSPTEIADLLRLLRLSVQEGDPSLGRSSPPAPSPLLVIAPTFRQDLKEEIDLIEEVARAHGYGKMPEHLPRASSGVGGLAPDLRFERQVRGIALGLGLGEAVTSSLEGPEDLARLNLPEDDLLSHPVRVNNAKTIDRSQLRTTLLTSLLGVVAENRRRGVSDVSIFDLGRVYRPGNDGELPDQPQHLGLAGAGRRWLGEWAMAKGQAYWDFYALKGIVETIVQSAARLQPSFAPCSHPVLHPGRAAEVMVAERAIGCLGEVRPQVREAFHLPDPVFAAELDLDLLRALAAGEPQYQPISRFPAMVRDVAFLLPRTIPAARTEAVVRAAAGEDLEALALFDAYEGDPLPAGQRNLAFSLTFRRSDRTLTDAEVEAAMEGVRAALREELGAQIRQ
jgi:phenylalanyl-tRNA synthetase beta chain